MQHLNSKYTEEDTDNELQTVDLLDRNTENSTDVVALAERGGTPSDSPAV